MGIELGVSTVDPEINSPQEYTVEIYKCCLDRIVKHGFKNIEYSHVDQLHMSDAEEIGDYAAQLGLVSYSVHAEGHILKYGRERYFEVQDICMRNAKRMGCKIVVFHLPYPEGNPTKEENIDEVKRFVEMALDKGLQPLLENGPIDLTLEIISYLNIPELKFVLDKGHAFRDGHQPYEIVKKLVSFWDILTLPTTSESLTTIYPRV